MNKIQDTIEKRQILSHFELCSEYYDKTGNQNNPWGLAVYNEVHTEKKKQSEIMITIHHLKGPQSWDGVGKKYKIFKQIDTKVRNCFKVFRHPGGLYAMKINNILDTSSSNQVLKKITSSMQKRRKINVGTGQEQLEK